MKLHYAGLENSFSASSDDSMIFHACGVSQYTRLMVNI